MVDVALYEAVFNMMESLVPEYDVAGVVRERTGGALPGIVPSNTYTTRDGQNVVIAGNGDAIFRRLMQAIGREDLAADPDLARNDGRARRVERSTAPSSNGAADATSTRRWARSNGPMCPWARSTAWPTCSPIRSSWRAA